MNHAADTLSLTLPDWRKAVRGVRRWKPPRPKSWFSAAQAAVAIFFLAHDLVVHDWAGVVIGALNVWAWWSWVWRGIPAFFTVRPDENGALPQIASWMDWLRFAWIAFQVTVALAALVVGVIH